MISSVRSRSSSEWMGKTSMGLDGRCVDAVVFGMGPHEPDEDDGRSISNDQSVLVPPDVEDDAIPTHEIRGGKRVADLRRPGPPRFPELAGPRRQWRARVRM